MTSAGERWVERYTAAWTSNDEHEIADLFTADAVYEHRPDDPDAAHGRDEIVADWLHYQDDPGWTFDWTVLAETPGFVAVTGRTVYEGAETWDNLWLIRLDDDGRATRFTEWAIARDDATS